MSGKRKETTRAVLPPEEAAELEGHRDERGEHVTEDEVQQALSEFKRRGGLVRRLPDDATPRIATVGDRYGPYENLFSFS